MTRLLRYFGYVLCLGGAAHYAGVLRLYLSEGRPEANRVLLDVWIGAAQIVGGAFFIASSRFYSAGGAWRTAALAGAATVLAYTLPFVPVLIMRDPRYFLIPPVLYTALCIYVVVYAIRWKGHAE